MFAKTFSALRIRAELVIGRERRGGLRGSANPLVSALRSPRNNLFVGQCDTAVNS